MTQYQLSNQIDQLKKWISNWNSTCRSKIASISKIQKRWYILWWWFFKELDISQKFILQRKSWIKCDCTFKDFKSTTCLISKSLLIGSSSKRTWNIWAEWLSSLQNIGYFETNVPYKVENTTTRTTLKVCSRKKGKTMVRIVSYLYFPFDTDDSENHEDNAEKTRYQSSYQNNKWIISSNRKLTVLSFTDTEVTNWSMKNKSTNLNQQI